MNSHEEFELTETGKIQSDYINASFDVLELSIEAYCDLDCVDLEELKRLMYAARSHAVKSCCIRHTA